MKKLIFPALFFILSAAIQAQQNKAEVLQDLEKNQQVNQNVSSTATLKTSSRLFGAKDDLTSVVTIIPAGSTVTVLGSDSTYLHVTFEESEGYIFKRHAVIDMNQVNASQSNQQPVEVQQQPEQEQQMSRFSYLENKYGSKMASKLTDGKIWKGMNEEMVNDSWGTPEKINKVISGNIAKEEWIFRKTWLYFENNTLVEWGPIKK